MTTVRILIIDYSDNESIEIPGKPVGILNHNLNQKRITLLVEDDPATPEQGVNREAQRAMDRDVAENPDLYNALADNHDDEVKLPFDPADYSVADLTDKVAGYGPIVLTAVLSAEEDGKARKSAVSMLKQAINDAR